MQRPLVGFLAEYNTLTGNKRDIVLLYCVARPGTYVVPLCSINERGCDMHRIILVLVIVPCLAGADRFHDGFYITGGGFFSDTNIDFLGDERGISDVRPMMFVGYSKVGRRVSADYRLFAGVEGFYMADSKTKGGTDEIEEEEVITETEEITTVTMGDVTTEVVTITRDIRTAPLETRSYEIKQGDTWGLGVRFGITEQRIENAGTLYLLAGYANTEVEGRGSIADSMGTGILTIPHQTLDFNGYYWGIGYEYAFNRRWAMRADYLRYNYPDKSFTVLDGASDRDSVLMDPGNVELDQGGLFIGISARF